MIRFLQIEESHPTEMVLVLMLMKRELEIMLELEVSEYKDQNKEGYQHSNEHSSWSR